MTNPTTSADLQDQIDELLARIKILEARTRVLTTLGIQGVLPTYAKDFENIIKF